MSSLWLMTALLLFLTGLQVASSGGMFGLFIGAVIFLLALLCLLGFIWSLRGFRPSHTIMPDGEKIDHGK